MNRVEQVCATNITLIPMAWGLPVPGGHHGSRYIGNRYMLAWKLSNTLEAGSCVAALEEGRARACRRGSLPTKDHNSPAMPFPVWAKSRPFRSAWMVRGGTRTTSLWSGRRVALSMRGVSSGLTDRRVCPSRDHYLYLDSTTRRGLTMPGLPSPAEVYRHDPEGKRVAAQESGLPSTVVIPSARAGDYLNLASLLS